MILDVSQLVLFGLLCASLHWLIARSEIARPFWSRVNGMLGKLLACPSCSGFWLGGFLSGIGVVEPVRIDLVTPTADLITHIIVGALLGVFVTPVVEGILLWGLERSAIREAEIDEDKTPVRSHTTHDSNITPIERPQQ
ncbi:MAG TPA: hypothetical protein VGY48_15355 [Vicinamibacterales bacterium]|jgi:hypothetical protein|nr:hypothetical protein [Vicinamibacterales bacterium]